MPDTSPQIPGTLIIIGQPPAGLSDLYYSKQTDRTILVEPDPVVAADVEKCLIDVTNLQIIAAVPWTEESPAELTIFNFPGLRSLYAPAASLKKLLPGLKELRKISVEGIPPKELMTQIGDVRSPVHAVINLAGSEYQVVNFWRETGFLSKIDRLDCVCGVEAFFHESKDVAELQDLLTNSGFDLGCQESDDPDWPLLAFHANPLKREIADLCEEIERCNAVLADTKAQLEEQTKSADAALAEAKTDLSVALRMQSILQADLSDLRRRFAETDRQRRAQEELLSQLTPRLQQAAEQIRYLSLPSEDHKVAEASGDAK